MAASFVAHRMAISIDLKWSMDRSSRGGLVFKERKKRRNGWAETGSEYIFRLDGLYDVRIDGLIIDVLIKGSGWMICFTVSSPASLARAVCVEQDAKAFS